MEICACECTWLVSQSLRNHINSHQSAPALDDLPCSKFQQAKTCVCAFLCDCPQNKFLKSTAPALSRCKTIYFSGCWAHVACFSLFFFKWNWLTHNPFGTINTILTVYRRNHYFFPSLLLTCSKDCMIITNWNCANMLHFMQNIISMFKKYFWKHDFLDSVSSFLSHAFSISHKPCAC